MGPESIKSAFQKRIENCDRCLIDFVSIWPPKGLPKSRLYSIFSGPFRLRASTWRPLAFKKQPEHILDDLFFDFWWFGGCFGTFPLWFWASCPMCFSWMLRFLGARYTMFFQFFVHVATCLKSWISLHWPCKSHALFLCSPTLLSRSSSAHTFPLSLFGAGLPLQVPKSDLRVDLFGVFRHYRR